MVAAKTFQTSRFSSEEMETRFRTEAEIWIKMGKHPNVVQALEFAILDEQPFLIMECVPRWGHRGPDLRSWMGERPWTIHGALWIALHVCNGLDFATRAWAQHGRRFAHRDLKPENLLVAPYALTGRLDALPHAGADRSSWFPQDYMIKVTDFGLASVFDEPALSAAGSSAEDSTTLGNPRRNVSGTPAYMSPEQIGGDTTLDARSDIYGFGCILYELTVGQQPFRGKTADEIFNGHLRGSLRH